MQRVSDGEREIFFDKMEVKGQRTTRMEKKTDLFTVICFLVCLSFYIFFALFDGAVLCADSPSYINMQSSREPLYPLLLAAMRGIFRTFPEGFYLNAVAVIQSILMAAAVFLLEEYLRKELRLSKLSAALILLMPLAVSLLCRFAARRGSMYSNSILTEGIAIPLYLIFFRFLIEYLIYNTKKSLTWCIVLSFLMVSTRKQMMVAAAMLAISILYTACRRKDAKYGLLTILISTALIFGSNSVLDIGYNYVVRGEKTTHSSDIRFIATVAFYTAERKDSDLIENPGTRALFLEIYDTCEEQGYLGHSAGEGWNNRVLHFGDYYDRIQIDTMWPRISLYVQENFECRQTQISQYEDAIMKEISKAVIPAHFVDVIRVFLDNFLSGLVLTVARQSRILVCYSVIIYIAYFGLLYFLAKRKGERKVLVISSAILLSVFFNVGLVSLVIFCQTRYTIYNMALFYIGMIIMVSAILTERG